VHPIEALRSVTAQGFRAFPWLPWHRPFRRRFNRLFLRLGAPATAVAPLQGKLRITVDLRANSQRDVLYLGSYDAELLACCERLLPPFCTVLDVGANVGLTSLPLARFAGERGGHVPAFEPVPSNLSRLRENIALNGLEELITIWPFGLSAEAGTANISLREDFDAGGTTGNAAIVIDASDARFAVQPIELRALDSLLDEAALSRIDFIKVDIEGHEDFFLAGAQRALAQHAPVVLMEVNKPYYARRGVDLNERVATLAPAYRVLRSERAAYRKWRACDDLAECQRLDNVFLVPAVRFDEVRQKLNG
jgi:FkbM family methyltransferase